MNRKIISAFILILISAPVYSAGTPASIQELRAEFQREYEQLYNNPTIGIEELRATQAYQQTLTELGFLNPRQNPCFDDIRLDKQAIYSFHKLYERRNDQRLFHPDTDWGDLYLLVEQIEQNKKAWLEEAKKDPKFRPHPVDIRDLNGHKIQVEIVPVPHENPEKDGELFVRLGKKVELGAGSYKTTNLVLRVSSWKNVARSDFKKENQRLADLQEEVNDQKASGSAEDAKLAEEFYLQEKRMTDNERKVLKGLMDLPENRLVGLVPVFGVTHENLFAEEFDMTLNEAHHGKYDENGIQLTQPVQFSNPEILSIFQQAGKGVEELHLGQGVVHSDLSYRNIMLKFPGDSGHPGIRTGIIDYGLAFSPAEFLKNGWKIKSGTYQYMPPERDEWTGATDEEKIQNMFKRDVFSLTAGLAHLLAPELVTWIKVCRPEYDEPSQYLRCQKREMAKVFAKRNDVKGEIQQFILQGLDPEVANRLSIAEWNTKLKQIIDRKNRTDKASASEEKEEAKHQSVVRQITSEDYRKLREARIERYGHFSEGKNTSLEQLRKLKHLTPFSDQPLQKVLADAAHFTPGTFVVVPIKSGLFKNKYRLAAVFKNAEGEVETRKLYLGLEGTDVKKLVKEYNDEIQMIRLENPIGLIN